MQLNRILYFPVPVMGKPRMTRKDKWHKRNATDSYWTMKDALVAFANRHKFTIGNMYHAIYLLPMAEKKSKKWKKEHEYQLHDQKPDIDNITKGIKDCLLDDDSKVAVEYAVKLWSYEPGIILFDYHESSVIQSRLDLCTPRWTGTEQILSVDWNERSGNATHSNRTIELVLNTVNQNSKSSWAFIGRKESPTDNFFTIVSEDSLSEFQNSNRNIKS